MLNRSSVKALVFFTAFAFTLLNCTASRADDVNIIYIRAIINENHRQYNEIASVFGEIWIGYTSANIDIAIQGGAGRFIIERANFYYIGEDGDFILMGSVDKTGVTDKDGNLLREISGTIAQGLQVLGISSLLVTDNSLLVNLILYPDRFGAFESEVWEFLDIDIENATISLMDRSGFWGP